MSTSALPASDAAGTVAESYRGLGLDRWLLGGVAAELAGWFSVPVGFIRVLLILAAAVQPHFFDVYVLAALVMPPAGRRWPGWSNLIAAWRIGVLTLLLRGMLGEGEGLLGGLFDQGPQVWVPVGGVCLVGLAALLATGRAAVERDSVNDRRAVLATLPLVALVAVIALGVVFLPGLYWERVLAGLVVASGIALAVGGRHLAVLIVPVAVLAGATLLMAAAGVQLRGGIGDGSFAPANAAAVPKAYRRAIGDLKLNLMALYAGSRPITVVASVGIGELAITIPNYYKQENVTVVERVGRGTLGGVLNIRARRGLAANHIFPSGIGSRSGYDLTRTVRTDRSPRHSPRVTVIATVGIGTLRLY